MLTILIALHGSSSPHPKNDGLAKAHTRTRIGCYLKFPSISPTVHEFCALAARRLQTISLKATWFSSRPSPLDVQIPRRPQTRRNGLAKAIDLDLFLSTMNASQLSAAHLRSLAKHSTLPTRTRTSLVFPGWNQNHLDSAHFLHNHEREGSPSATTQSDGSAGQRLPSIVLLEMAAKLTEQDISLLELSSPSPSTFWFLTALTDLGLIFYSIVPWKYTSLLDY
ncbi:hypothetical protein DL96DRAFT_1713553 [Flagelloscypha sp. PMI_526]|nr:hypothetical protein DL96DRAFT_1713553 [Flagelloscypha sp. PMI_526]